MDDLRQHIDVLVNTKKDLLSRHSSALKIAEIAKRRHECLPHSAKRTMNPTPTKIQELCAGLSTTTDLKGDLVEIEACAALVADWIRTEFVRRNL